MTARCARRGCSRPLPPLALCEGDGYCSTDCCRIAHGLQPAKLRTHAQRARRCAGCGCGMDERTTGCRSCFKRHHNRDAAGQAAA